MKYDSQSNTSYLIWNEEIAKHFFGHHSSGKPVYLQVDSEVIQLIGQKLGIPKEYAEENFIQCIRKDVNYNSKEPFKNIIRDIRHSPLSTNNLPSFIAFLAFCVLAVSKMEKTPEISSSNYYHHLNKLLGIKEIGRPNRFDEVVDAWKKLEEWLNVIHHGEFGISTARPLNSFHPYVSYPQSQYLLRKNDRQKLPMFFRRFRLQPEDTPSISWVSDRLGEWVALTTCPLSSLIKSRIQKKHKHIVDHIAAIVILELQSWDGLLPEESIQGASLIRKLLHLKFDVRGKAAYWRSYILQKNDEFTERYIPEPTQHILNEFPPNFIDYDDDIIVFGNHPDLGEWVQQSRITRAYPSVILVRENIYSHIEAHLHDWAEPGWRLFHGEGIPKGWRCIRGVNLKSPNTDIKWENLKIYDDITIQLTGGLKLARNTYLYRFAPSLEIHATGQHDPVTIDDQIISIQSEERPIIIPLNEYCDRPGYHKISIGTRTRTFFMHESRDHLLSKPDSPAIAYHLYRRENEYYATSDSPFFSNSSIIEPNTICISGALLYGRNEDFPKPLPHSISITSGAKRYIILGQQPGEIFEYQAPRQFTSFSGSISQYLIHIVIPFDPQWLIRITRNRGYLSALQPEPNLPSSIALSTYDSETVSKWCNWILKNWKFHGGYIKKWLCDHSYESIWQAYRSTASVFGKGK